MAKHKSPRVSDASCVTEAEAWRAIAEYRCQYPCARGGLCEAINQQAGRLSGHIRGNMRRRITHHLGGAVYAYPVDYGCAIYYRPEDREARILAALWMAHEAEEGEGETQGRPYLCVRCDRPDCICSWYLTHKEG